MPTATAGSARGAAGAGSAALCLRVPAGGGARAAPEAVPRSAPPSRGAGRRPPLPLAARAHLHAQVGQAGLQAGLQRQQEGGGGCAARRVGEAELGRDLGQVGAEVHGAPRFLQQQVGGGPGGRQAEEQAAQQPRHGRHAARGGHKMAAPALYGVGTRWRRPAGEEAHNGGAQRRLRPPPPAPRGRAAVRVPEEKGRAGGAAAAGRVPPQPRCRLRPPAVPGGRLLSPVLSGAQGRPASPGVPVVRLGPRPR